MLFDPIQVRHLRLANRAVMATMTRSRAVGNLPIEISLNSDITTSWPVSSRRQ